MESYCDLLVIRTKNKNSLQDLQNKIKIPIINAGDGDGRTPYSSVIGRIYY